MIKRLLKDLAWDLYSHCPPQTEELLNYSKSHLALHQKRTVPVSILRGVSRAEGGGPATVLAIGNPRNLEYPASMIFAGEPASETLGQFPWRSMRKQIAEWQSRVDLTIGHIPGRASQKIAGDDCLVMPEWAAMTVPVPEDFTALRKASKSLTDDFRMMKRHNLSIVHSPGMAELPHFFEHMHLPLIRSRYGEHSFVYTLNKLEHLCRRDGIIWIEREGVKIAGALHHRIGKTLRFVALGTLDGDYAYAKMGAIATLYIGIFDHARKLGCHTVDLGGVRPSLVDGLFTFKRKWGGKIGMSRVSLYHYVMHWQRWNSVVADFLQRTAPVFFDGRDMRCVYLKRDEETPDYVHRYRWTPGLRQLYLIDPATPPGTALPPGMTALDATEAPSSATLRKHLMS